MKHLFIDVIENAELSFSQFIFSLPALFFSRSLQLPQLSMLFSASQKWFYHHRGNNINKVKSFSIELIKEIIEIEVLNDFKAISDLSLMSKSVEGAAHQLTASSILKFNNLFDTFQSGFLSGHSNETSMTWFVNNLLITADSNLTSLLLLLSPWTTAYF